MSLGLLSACASDTDLVEYEDGNAAFLSVPCATCVRVKDLFAGTGALTAHVPDVGTGWARVTAGTTGDPVIGSGVVRAAADVNARGQAYVAMPAPTTAGQLVQVTLSALDSSSGTKPVGIFGRRVDDANLYFVQILPNASSQPSVQLYKRVAGVVTQLASADVALAAGDQITLSLGDAAKTVYVDGTEILSSPDNTLTAPGSWGLFLGGYPVAGHLRKSWALDGFIASTLDGSEDPTDPTDPPNPTPGAGIWIAGSALAARPTSGAAWTALKTAADKSCGTPNLADQDDPANVCVMAKALVYARIGGEATYRKAVADAIRSLVANPGCDGASCQAGKYTGRALALGRELAAYVIAADLVGLASYDPALDTQFRTTLRYLLDAPTHSGPTSLKICHEQRPNNWGTHCGASRVAVAAYLGDTVELARVAKVFRGWLGDRTAYAGFTYGELCWQASPAAPVGINPPGATINGLDVDGVLPDDQRRSGVCVTSPFPKENYVYEALQGALATAILLERAGYTDVFTWQTSALRRAFTWLHSQASYPAAADDTWEPHVINHFYGSNFPAPVPSAPGKNVGFTDWTHP